MKHVEKQMINGGRSLCLSPGRAGALSSTNISSSSFCPCPSFRSPSTSPPFSLSLGHLQSEALWPVSQLRGSAPLPSFFFLRSLKSVCNLSSVCARVQVEYFRVDPHITTPPPPPFTHKHTHTNSFNRSR